MVEAASLPRQIFGAGSLARPAVGADRLWTLSLSDDISAVEAEWRNLLSRAWASPYQDHAFVAAWVRHVAPQEGTRIALGLVRDTSRRLVMILPFGVQRRSTGGLGVYLGGSHSNVNMPIVDRDVLACLRSETSTALLAEWCHMAGAAALALFNQPTQWDGTVHPFATIGRSIAPDRLSRFSVEPGADGFSQLSASRHWKDLRRKEKRLLSGGAVLRLAVTPAETSRVLDAYFAQKAARLATMGVDDPFAEPGVAEFLRDAAIAGLSGEGLSLATYDVEGHAMAIAAIIRWGRQRSFFLLSCDRDHPLARNSAGELLFANLLLEGARVGFDTFDFGIGDETYKNRWASGTTEMVDTILGYGLLGGLAALRLRLGRRLVGAIKRNRALYRWIKAARARRSSMGSWLPGQRERP